MADCCDKTETCSLSLSDIINCMTEKNCDNNNNYYYTSSCCDTSTECYQTTEPCDDCNDCDDCNTDCCETNSCDNNCNPCNETNNCNENQTMDCDCCDTKCKKCVSTKQTCEAICSNYNLYKDCIIANNEALVILEFILNKVIDAMPVIITRNACEYTIQENICFIEKFFDSVLCVASSNNICNKIAVKTCKIKNDCNKIDNRVYEIGLHYQTCVGNKEFCYTFQWKRLTANTTLSYKNIVAIIIRELQADIIQLKAENTGVFFAS